MTYHRVSSDYTRAHLKLPKKKERKEGAKINESEALQ